MDSKPIDLSAYLDRIGFGAEWTEHLPPTAAVLASLHEAHVTAIPFENLDILLGRPIRLDRDSLEAKLVRAKRGGYCFEQNTLFSLVLEQLGFSVTRLAARVRFGTTRILPRTHMLLRVDADGGSWLADVGFGGEGLLRPVPLVQGAIARQGAWTFEVVKDSGPWVLRSRRGAMASDLYAFSLEPQFPIDFEVANYYVSTHPDSRFTQTLTVQRTTPARRLQLVNHEWRVDDGRTGVTHPIGDADHLLAVLAEIFGLRFPVGTRFHPRSAGRPGTEFPSD